MTRLDSLEMIESELRFFASRSRGPGGQNVNKVNSAALLLWAYQESAAFNYEQKLLIQEKLSNFINREGDLYLRSDEYRDLERNKSRCRQKLFLLIQKALHKPKKRVATKPTKASKRKRLESKRHRSQIKKSRGQTDD